MKLEDLLGKGYIPRELPPPFTSTQFRDFYIGPNNSSLPSPQEFSKGVKFSIPKIGIFRRTTTLTNPQHQAPLFKCIADNWANINNYYGKSSISFSKPMIDIDGDRAANFRKNIKEFKTKCFEESYHHKFELRVDISNYFPNIYTHSIPWAIHTKEVSKRNRGNSLWGNGLDKLIRNTQDAQTIGIPVGPDSSYIIAELIGTAIDKHIQEKFPGITGYRYVDDMCFYLHDQAGVDACLKEILFILREYELQINTEKTKVTQLPVGINEEWNINLRKFDFRTYEGIKGKQAQHHDLIDYFSLAFDYSRKYSNQPILKYAIKRIAQEAISKENFPLYESMLYKTISVETSTLPDVLRILLSYESLIKKDKLKITIQTIIQDACQKGYDFELAWSLWYLITFNIKIDDIIAKELNQVTNSICILMILDLMDRQLVNIGVINTEKWKAQISEDSLWDERWILAYEISVKNWLLNDYTYIDQVAKNNYYKILKDNNISFYHTHQQIAPTKLHPSGLTISADMEYEEELEWSYF